MQDYKEHHDHVNVDFVVNVAAKEVEKAESQGLIEYLNLSGAGVQYVYV